MKLLPIFAIFLALSLAACGKPTAPDSPDPSTYGLTYEGEVPEGRHGQSENPDSN